MVEFYSPTIQIFIVKNAALPSNLPGIHMADGLACMNHNALLFHSILLKYAQGQHDALRRMRNALDAGDTETAHRAAHTLKGVSGNIGASAIQEAAERLEVALQNAADPNELRDLLVQAEPLLLQVIEGINSAFSLMPTTPPRAFNPADLSRQVAVLRDMLRCDDADSCALFADQRALFQAALGPNFAATAQAIDGFDFEAALALLPAEGPTSA